MIIYGVNDQSSFGSSDCYKSASNQKGSNIRSKTVKRVTQRQKVKKVKKVKKLKNSKKQKKLSIKNVKFLKSLGFKVKKR